MGSGGSRYSARLRAKLLAPIATLTFSWNSPVLRLRVAISVCNSIWKTYSDGLWIS